MIVDSSTLSAIADEVARALSQASVIGRSAFLTTSVSYPNGSRVVVRLDRVGIDEFFVSDDGYGALAAEMLGGLPSFARVARKIAQQAGVQFDERSFFVLLVSRAQLPAATVAIAGASQRAVERTIYALEERRVIASREIFRDRVRGAFGEGALFDIEVPGQTGKEWRMDAAVERHKSITAVFALVRPNIAGVAGAHLKCSDIRRAPGAPHVIAALADYQRTPAELRALMMMAADSVIAANDDIAAYRTAA